MGIWYGNMIWEYDMGIWYGNMIWEYDMGIWYGNMIWEYDMGIWYGNMMWQFYVYKYTIRHVSYIDRHDTIIFSDKVCSIQGILPQIMYALLLYRHDKLPYKQVLYLLVYSCVTTVVGRLMTDMSSWEAILAILYVCPLLISDTQNPVAIYNCIIYLCSDPG